VKCKKTNPNLCFSQGLSNFLVSELQSAYFLGPKFVVQVTVFGPSFTTAPCLDPLLHKKPPRFLQIFIPVRINAAIKIRSTTCPNNFQFIISHPLLCLFKNQYAPRSFKRSSVMPKWCAISCSNTCLISPYASRSFSWHVRSILDLKSVILSGITMP